MSALVCGKRTAFDDLSSPGAPPATTQKRARIRISGSPTRYIPSPGGGWSPASPQDKVAVLRGLFPSMTSEELQRALEECGHDLDLTIKGLNLLCLGSASAEPVRDVSAAELRFGVRSHGSPEERALTDSAAVAAASAEVALAAAAAAAATGTGEAQAEGGAQPDANGAAVQQGVPESGPEATSAAAAAPPPDPSGADVLSSVLSVEWVDAVVQEMMSARDLDDARQRAARVLQSFGSVALEKANGCKEHQLAALKTQLSALQRDNHILKRAVAIQHDRHRAHEAREAEVGQLKQMLAQYQEQMRKLEVNNYALNLHLQKAQVDSSLPNRFHPDVF